MGLAHPYGFPKIMSSYYFKNFNQGPPSASVHGQNGELRCGGHPSHVSGRPGSLGFASTAGHHWRTWYGGVALPMPTMSINFGRRMATVCSCAAALALAFSSTGMEGNGGK